MEKLPNGTVYNEAKFPYMYSKIIYLANSTINWDTGNSIIFRLFSDKSLNNSVTCRINYWMELLQDKYQYLFYQCTKILIPNSEFTKLFPDDLQDIISCYNDIPTLSKKIKQYKISDKIKHVNEQFKTYLNIENNNYNCEAPCYFFGLYNEVDLSNLISHKGDKHLIFGGSDLDITMYHTKVLIPKLKNLLVNTNIQLYFISDNLYKRGTKMGLTGNLIKLDMIGDKWDILRDDLIKIKQRNTIYCYTGYKKIGKLYNYNLLKRLENRLPQFKFIYSHTCDLNYIKMHNIYNECFMGIRLTKKDGNANTVIEMGKLGLPVIFNGDNYNAINYQYDNIDDIIIKILSFKL
ncbi:hypothetical protein crov275 [Cafeteria roenbergensis virus]|uniref:Uncharacterized protein n=1 Tax=Cafeteria roenbergensis virus (strain BV-PW1) TaxID=693272 RepID=E3T545_CROVB|nr:hypothetical protein crov275 [Cafeteria roenbergensis virus BV-PW1]ADO67308.1 hypothetical protein crov275 [Cafeteria roenbergensis virus BV-PW1]